MHLVSPRIIRAAFAIGVVLSLGPIVAHAQPKPRVQAIMFWSTSCEHCHKVIAEVLPNIEAQYGEQFDLTLVEIGTVAGYDLWRKAWDVFSVPESRRGVPMVIVADKVLLGDVEIAKQLPTEIERGLAGGGVALRPELAMGQATAEAHQRLSIALLTATPPPATRSTQGTPTAGAESGAATGEVTTTAPVTAAGTTGAPQAVRPALARALGWLVFIVLLVTAVYGVLAVGQAVWRPRSRPLWAIPARLDWLIPLVALVGVAIAAYLSHKEITGSPTFCPVGACDAVQQSRYAKLLGIPVAVLGLASYLAILGLWLWWKYGRGWTAQRSIEALFGLSLFGVLFSTYLTAAELFLIKEICMWCLASAMTIALLVWLSVDPARQRWATLRVRSSSRHAAQRAGSPPNRRSSATARPTSTGALPRGQSTAGSGSKADDETIALGSRSVGRSNRARRRKARR